MNHIYDDYSRARIGFFFGLTGWQLTAVGLGVLPVLWATNRGDWTAAGAFLATWLALAAVVVTPIRGRSATGWLVAVTAHAAGTLTGWTRFRSRASRGATEDLDEVDLPGVLAGIEVHEAPPAGPDQRRVAIIQNHTVRTWAVTASVTHPGIGLERPGHPGPVRRRAGHAARRGRPHRAGRRDRHRGAHRPRGRRRTRPVDHPPPPTRRPHRGPGGQRRPASQPDRGLGAHRGVRHRRRPRVPDRAGRQGGRRRLRRTRPGPARP